MLLRACGGRGVQAGCLQAGFQLGQQAAGFDHVGQEAGDGLAGQITRAGGLRAADVAGAGVEGDGLAVLDQAGLRAGQQQQADVEGIALVQAPR